MKGFLKTGEVAKMCLKSPKTIARLFDKGEFGGYRGRGERQDRFYSSKRVLAFLKENKIPSSRRP